VQRYFRDHTLVAVLSDGSWLEIKHRGDLARIHKEHPDWVGTVLCGSSGGVAALRAELLDNTVEVERWNMDERVIEGRRPEGPQFVLHRMVWSGLDAVGGAKQVVDAVLPGANKPLQKAAAALVAEYGETAALRLSIACAVRGIVSDDELAGILAEPSVYELQPWMGVEIAVFRTNFLRATEHVPQRRGALIRNLLTGETLTNGEIVTAIDMADRISPELADKLLNINTPGLSDLVVDIACLHGLSREQHLQILCGDSYNAKSNLAKNTELDASTVEEAYRKGAALRDLYDRMPMTDTLIVEILAFYKGGHVRDLCANTGLSDEQLRRVMQFALLQPRKERTEALWLLASNPSTSTQTRLDLVHLALEPRDALTVRSALAGNATNSMEVYRALVETNDAELCLEMMRGTRRVAGSRSSERLCVRMDQETLRAACDVQDPTVQVLAVTELLQRSDIGVTEELRLVETCDVTTWPRIARFSRHVETVERILEKAADFESSTRSADAAVSLLNQREVRMDAKDLTPGGIMEHVAGNNKGGVTKELVNRLAVDPRVSVSMSALYASGAKVDEDVRVHVALSHPEGFVRNAAFKTRECLDELQRVAMRELPASSDERRWLVSEASLSEETQRHIIQHGSLSELLALGANKGELSGETQESLMSHQSTDVRRTAAARRDLHGAALDAARTDPDEQTREAILEPRFGQLYDVHGEHVDDRLLKELDEKRQVEQQAAARQLDGLLATKTTPVGHGARTENRDVSDIHVITSAGSEKTLVRSHHPVEYAADPAAMIRDSIQSGADERDRYFLNDVSDVRSLPGWGVLPFRGAERAKDALDGYQCSVTALDLLDDRAREAENVRLVEGEDRGSLVPQVVPLVARVLDSSVSIAQNAEYMGNCTGGYVSAVAKGEVQLVGLYNDDGVCQLNVELKRDGDLWRPGEINTRFNGYGYGYDATPESVKVIADQLAERLNSSQPSAR
jgi:hypothetical protein